MSDRIARSTRLWAVSLTALLVIAVSGCASVGLPAPSASPTALAATEGTDPDAVAPTGAECIVGSWLLDNDSFADLISSIDAQVIDKVSGVARFRASADGGAVTEYVDWTHVIRMTDPEGVVTMVRNGVDSGVYTEDDDGTFSLQEHSNESTIVVEMTSQGVAVTMPQVENSPGALHLAVFSCDGDRLTVTVDDRSSVMIRER